ncbi:MAG: AAA family ATPase [Acidobacteria bacterium]|nr:AAA family ATPase [Acidobacteriota bacterium]
MRIDKVYIKNFKNLREFKIDLDETEMKTVLLGQNASGKSNFIEAIILIFKYLDLSNGTTRKYPEFDFAIDYKVKRNHIRAICENSSYSIEVNGQALSLKSFFSDEGKLKYQPKNVFAYYSGISNKLKELFWDHQNRFYEEIIKPDFDAKRIDDLRKLFYVQLVHSYFVLLAYFSFETEEKDSVAFLKGVLEIEDLESVLFVLKKPDWAESRARKNPSDIFWTAEGLVRDFLDLLWKYSTAPISNSESIRTDFRSHVTEDRLYVFIKDKKQLKSLAHNYQQNTEFFKALESTYISKLIAEVRIKVKKKNVDCSITFRDLSEGEQQLLTVLGLLKFTKDEESLILLDEPDTHLNPIWKWQYLEFLENVVKRPESTQIIINTHDPLVIGSLKKGEVRIFRTDQSGNIYTEEPDMDPRERSVAGILTSKLFGLPSVMSKEVEDKLNRKRFLQSQIEREQLSPNEIVEFETLRNELDDIGFYDTTIDSRYNKFLELTSRHPVFQKSILTKEEEAELERISQEVANEILNPA